MFFGRIAHAIPILAIAGSLAAKKKAKPSAGTVPTNDATFVVFLLGVIAVTTALQYLCPRPRPGRRALPASARGAVRKKADSGPTGPGTLLIAYA